MLSSPRQRCDSVVQEPCTCDAGPPVKDAGACAFCGRACNAGPQARDADVLPRVPSRVRAPSERTVERGALHSIFIYVRASERESGAQGGERANGERRSGETLHLPSPTLSPHTRELRRAPAMRAPSNARARSSSPLTLRYSGRTTCSGC
ncbi:hypothetical protein HPB50_019997 [Hyalomma asiaticum]|uniref:Uncharacterized protein n=1 Tax=Hyalomma asiaticum TaxID=266040 RepID=A0ACB7SRD2_HYAAI|nr:hypothetical protein HPB50_019997 [Hyalomma asiaticum]